MYCTSAIFYGFSDDTVIIKIQNTIINANCLSSTSRTSDLYHSIKSQANYRLPASLQVATLMAGDSALRRGMQPASAYAPLYNYGYRTPSSVLARVGAAQQQQQQQQQPPPPQRQAPFPSQRQQPPTAGVLPLPRASSGAARSPGALLGTTVRYSAAVSAPSAAAAATRRAAPSPAANVGSGGVATFYECHYECSQWGRCSAATTAVMQPPPPPPSDSRPSVAQSASAAFVSKPSTLQPVKPPRVLPEPSSPPPASSASHAAAVQTQQPAGASNSIAAAVVTTSVMRTQVVPVSSASPPEVAASSAEFAAAAAGDTVLDESSQPAPNVSQSAMSQAHEASYSSNTFEAEEEDTSAPASPQHGAPSMKTRTWRIAQTTRLRTTSRRRQTLTRALSSPRAPSRRTRYWTIAASRHLPEPMQMIWKRFLSCE